MAANKDKPAWTDFADDVIRTIYPKGGVAACMKLLPDRTRGSIYMRAHRLLASNAQESRPWPMPMQEFASAHRLFMACDVAAGGERRAAL